MSAAGRLDLTWIDSHDIPCLPRKTRHRQPSIVGTSPFGYRVTDAQSGRGERYDSTENPRLRDRLSRAGDGPKAIGQSIIRDLEDFSAGHAQFDDITLICFGPVAPAGCDEEA